MTSTSQHFRRVDTSPDLDTRIEETPEQKRIRVLRQSKLAGIAILIGTIGLELTAGYLDSKTGTNSRGVIEGLATTAAQGVIWGRYGSYEPTTPNQGRIGMALTTGVVAVAVNGIVAIGVYYAGRTIGGIF